MSLKLIKDLGTRASGKFFDKKLNRYRTRMRRYYRVKCECGNVYEVASSDFGRVQKCNDCKNIKHNLSRSYINACHKNMIQRCTNPKNPVFKHYGGRGIKVCDRWLGKDGFINFVKDMGKRPSSKHSIDRIDNDGNYEPANCRWATQKQQCNNMQKTKKAA